MHCRFEKMMDHLKLCHTQPKISVHILKGHAIWGQHHTHTIFSKKYGKKVKQDFLIDQGGSLENQITCILKMQKLCVVSHFGAHLGTFFHFSL